MGKWINIPSLAEKFCRVGAQYHCLLNPKMDDLLAQDSILRSGIPCEIVEEPLLGGSHKVFKAIFQDSVNGQRERQRPEIKAPATYWDETYPVIFTELIEGEPLGIWNLHFPTEQRQGFLDNVADFVLLLWSVPVPHDLAAGISRPYAVWPTESLDRGLRRTVNGTARWGDAVKYLIMRSMIPSYTAELDKYNALGFAHGDLNAYNFIRTTNVYLAGVTAWDWAHVAPLPAIIHHPWFLAAVPGWNNDGQAQGDNFSGDRSYLRAAVAMKEAIKQLPPTVSSLLRDSGERLFFQSGFHFKGIHERFVQMRCQWTKANLEAAQIQLDARMVLYPDLEQAGRSCKHASCSR